MALSHPSPPPPCLRTNAGRCLLWRSATRLSRSPQPDWRVCAPLRAERRSCTCKRCAQPHHPNLHLAYPALSITSARVEWNPGTRRLPGVRQVDLPEDPNLPGAGVAPAKQVFATAAPIAAIAAKRSSGDHPSPRTRGLSDGVGRRASASSEAGRAASDHGEGGADPELTGVLGSQDAVQCSKSRHAHRAAADAARAPSARGAGAVRGRLRGVQAGAVPLRTRARDCTGPERQRTHRLPPLTPLPAGLPEKIPWRVASYAGGCGRPLSCTRAFPHCTGAVPACAGAAR